MLRRIAAAFLLAMLAGPAGGLAQQLETTDGIEGLLRQLKPTKLPSASQAEVMAALGSGDPVTTFATGLATPFGLAFDDAGNLFVAENGANRIARITPGGALSVFATGITEPWGVAFDAFGNLLVASLLDSMVYKVSPQGQVSSFISTPMPIWIATGPDGSIWVSHAQGEPLKHYDALGRFKEQFNLGNAFFIAVSPGGDLYYSDLANVYRLVNGDPQTVVSGVMIWGFAFDELGNFYAPRPALSAQDTGRVTLYGPTGSVLEDAFISGAQASVAFAFGRETDGTTNSRMFLSDLGSVLAILEANPAGAQAPGWPVVGLSLGEVALENTAGSVLGIEGLLTEDELAFLDVLGNNNGFYDVGDFRAYLIATNVVGQATSSRLTLMSGGRVGIPAGSR